MQITQKCQYALRAVFELAKRNGQGPVKIADIADVQAIPPRFLEVILSQLKQAGFVDSRRGSRGGYFLARSPARITVGEVIRFIQGPIEPVDCFTQSPEGSSKASVRLGRSKSGSSDRCPLYGECVFLPMWQKVKRAISDVYDNITFQDLLEQERQRRSEPSYSI